MHFKSELQELIVHTGQHYDENMSEVFFRELGIPLPDFNLQVGSGSHGEQTAKMLSGIEELLLKEKPDAVLVYGDTNSTIAGALAASKIHIPVVHVEAGLRSYNKSMPEEINRIACDHMSTLLFSPTKTGVDNLKKEGFSTENEGEATINNPFVYHCGDVMYDNSLYFSTLSEQNSTILSELGLLSDQYILCTIHRDSNTDDPRRLASIVSALIAISEQKSIQLVLPLHPRTKNKLKENLSASTYDLLMNTKQIRIIPPAGFLDIIALERHASLILTDSGGLQKEAYFFQKPCVIIRPQTEWVEIIEQGAGILADADEQAILKACSHFLGGTDLKFPLLYGDGKAAEFICKELLKHV